MIGRLYRRLDKALGKPRGGLLAFGCMFLAVLAVTVYVIHFLFPCICQP
jgi:hypothetical protein